MNNNNFNSEWNLWYHKEVNDWSKNSFENIYKITSPIDFWALIKNFDFINEFKNVPFYIMKNNIIPLWEEPENINGCEISIKIDPLDIGVIWKNLIIDVLCENIDNSYIINGISLHINNQIYIIKIWLFNNIDLYDKLPVYLKKYSICINKYNYKLKKKKHK